MRSSPCPAIAAWRTRSGRVYDLYGAGDRFALLETEGPHEDTPELRLGAFRWMNRWLKARHRRRRGTIPWTSAAGRDS